MIPGLVFGKGFSVSDTEADSTGPEFDAAEAASSAASDALGAARAAVATTTSARAAAATADAATRATRSATASVVAAAALTAADVAISAASTVKAEAMMRAVDVAASAARASERAAAEPSAVAHPEEAKRMAAVVAAAVASEVIAQADLRDDAASRVELAVARAADAAASAAVKAASLVEAAAGEAQTSVRDVVESSGAAVIASAITVESTDRAAKLARTHVARRQPPMIAELERAVAAEELRLHFQPMYSMGTGAIEGVEALIRWQHPTRGLLYPADFLDVAESPELASPIGDWVLRAAAAQASAWRQELGDTPVMWVNISSNQLGHHHLTGVIERVLAESSLAPGMLGIELTERQLARREDEVTDELLKLREVGVSLAVDDFGMGYASLDYLRRFAFNVIKIDKSFVSGPQDRTNTAVTSSIITLAHSLDLTVVGEGVETAAQLNQLRMLGCDVAQGYFLQRPAAPQAITDLLRSRALSAAADSEHPEQLDLHRP